MSARNRADSPPRHWTVLVGVSALLAWPFLYSGAVHIASLIAPSAIGVLAWLRPPDGGLCALPVYVLYVALTVLWLAYLRAWDVPKAPAVGDRKWHARRYVMLLVVGASSQFMLMRASSEVLFKTAGGIERQRIEESLELLPDPVVWGPREPPWMTAALSGLDGAQEELILVALIITLARLFRIPWSVTFLVTLLFRWTIHLYFGPIHAIFRVTLWSLFAVWWFLRTRSILPIWLAHFVANAFRYAEPWRDTVLEGFAAWWVKTGEILAVSTGVLVLAFVVLLGAEKRTNSRPLKSPKPTALRRHFLAIAALVFALPIGVKISFNLYRLVGAGVSRTFNDSAWLWILIGVLSVAGMVVVWVFRESRTPTTAITPSNVLLNVAVAGVLALAVLIGSGLFENYKYFIPSLLKNTSFSHSDSCSSVAAALCNGYFEIAVALVVIGVQGWKRSGPLPVGTLYACLLMLRFLFYLDLGVAASALLTPVWGGLVLAWLLRTGMVVTVWSSTFVIFVVAGSNFYDMRVEAWLIAFALLGVVVLSFAAMRRYTQDQRIALPSLGD